MIKDGEVKTPDLADSAVTSAKIADGTIKEQDIADGVIPDGGVQPTVHYVRNSVSVPSPPAFNLGGVRADCPDGEILTGGGFDRAGNIGDLNVLSSQPSNGENSWSVFVENIGSREESIAAVAVCMDFSP